jgi:hypothetical protein
MQPELTPPGRPRPNSLIMLVEGVHESSSSFLGAMNPRRTMDVWGVEVRDGSYAGQAAIQLRGTRINGVIAKGHWLDIPRSEIGPNGRVKHLLNLSTGREVFCEYNFFDWFH